MTGSGGYLGRLAVLGAGLLLYWLLMATLPRTGQGILLLLHGLAAVGVGLAIAYRRRLERPGLWSALAASLFLLLWGIGEVGWASSFFLYSKSQRAPAVVLVTELLYFLAFGCCAVSMLSAIDSGLRAFFSRWVVAIPLVLTTPIAFRLILHPFLSHRDVGLTAFNLGETAVIAISYLVLNLALIVLISARSLDWSIFAAGILCLVFGDWSIRAAKIMGQPIEFGLGSFFILFGLYGSSLPFLRRAPREGIQRFEPTSILNSFRLGLLVVALSMVLVYAIYQRDGAQTLKILCLGSSAVAFASVIISQMMVERIQWFSTELGRVLRSELEQPGRADQAPDVALPLELREIYRLVFSSTIRQQKLREEQRSLEQIRRLQTQVAHDIRSPLAALTVAVSQLKEGASEDSQQLLRRAADRIKEIATDLLDQNRREESDPLVTERNVTSAPIDWLVEDVVAEKRLQHSTRAIEINSTVEQQDRGFFVAANQSELKRALSNLIDNAVEASPPLGRVLIRVATEDPHVLLSVSDVGKGIPTEILPRLGEQGFTHDKPGGSGLGLYHARTFLAQCGGTLAIRSEFGVGTTVEIKLPRSATPAWFVEQIVVEAGTVLVLDDEEAIHATWDRLFAPYLQEGIQLLHFREEGPLRAWLAAHRGERFLGLIDYQLAATGSTGLDLIEQEGIAAHAILVTGRSADASLMQRVATLGLKLLPKELVGQTPIVPVPSGSRALTPANPSGLRMLVVDDDEMIARLWRQQQKQLGIAELRTFPSMEACEAAQVPYETFDLAFVDLRIDGTAWPIDGTIRYLKERGVRRVYIATGADAESEPLCQDADGIAADKVPDSLDALLRGARSR